MAREIDWSSAEVDDAGTLTVRLDGEADLEWMQALEQTFGWMNAESNDGGWGEIAWSPETIRVEAVDEDSVAALRRYLDDAVANANEAVKVDAVLKEHGSASEGVDSETAARMTEEFRCGD